MGRKKPEGISASLAMDRVHAYRPSCVYPFGGPRPIIEAVQTLGKLDDRYSRRALAALLRRILDAGVPPPSRHVFEELCDIAGANKWEGVLPQLKAFVSSWRRLTVIRQSKQGPRISGLASWRGPEALIACKAILAIDGVTRDDISHPAAIRIQRIIADTERALDDLDAFAKSVRSFDEQDELRKKYWQSIDHLESELTDMLDGEKLTLGEPDALRHSFRVIERFDFSQQAYGLDDIHDDFIEAFGTLKEARGVSRRFNRDLVALTKRASGSDYLDHFQDAFLPVCRLIAERNISGSLRYLKKLRDVVWDETRSSLGNPGLLRIAFCRAILELEGVSPKSRDDPTARIAKKAMRKFSKYVKWRDEVWMLCDVGDGKPEELDTSVKAQKQLETMEALLYEGFGTLDAITMHPWGM